MLTRIERYDPPWACSYLKAGFAFSESLGYALGDCLNFMLTMALAISTAAGNAPMRFISW